MSTIPSASLQFSSTQLQPPIAPTARKPLFYRPTFTTRATDSETPPAESGDEAGSESGSDPDAFESRLSQVRVRYRSGTGKKAEVRKVRKKGTSTTSAAGGGIYLPPVPLKEPVSEGLKVDFGFSPFSEKINGRIAMLGLTALVLVELATGKGVINYHTPAIVLIQVYFVAAVGAVYIKYEKEKVSIWPQE